MNAIAAIRQAGARNPGWMDEASRTLHESIAEKIRRQPQLLGIAVENLRLWKHSAEPAMRPLLRRWKLIILTWELEEILTFLTDPSFEAVKLRQVSPFCGVLTEPERQQALAKAA